MSSISGAGHAHWSSVLDVGRRTLQHSVRLVPWWARTFVKRMPLVAAFQRLLLARFLDNQEFIHTVDAGPGRGLKFPVLLPDDKGVWTGTYEADFLKALAHAIQPGGVCLDIGGWHGFCGCVMARQGAGRVLIFEPLPENCARIRRAIELNPDLPVELVDAAVGSSSGRAEFQVMPGTSMGKLSDSEFQPDADSVATVSVPVLALDEWADTACVEPPSVIKIDVEGAELLVLQGAKGLISDVNPTLFIEVHGRKMATTVVEFLSPFPYSIRCLETGAAPDGVTEPDVCHIVAESIGETSVKQYGATNERDSTINLDDQNVCKSRGKSY